MNPLKLSLKILTLGILFFSFTINSQHISLNAPGSIKGKQSPGFWEVKEKLSSSTLPADTLKKNLVRKKSISALFIGLGGGLSIPVAKFKETANPIFGVLGRLEFSSTGIFPFVIGGEVNYYSYNSPDEFRTINLLTGYKTKILSVGLNIDYSLSKLIPSSFTMPFISVDVKSNSIKREFDSGRTFDGLSPSESKVSVGAGIGFTLFILDFTVKYNYIKDNSFVSVTTKTKFPLIRF